MAMVSRRAKMCAMFRCRFPKSAPSSGTPPTRKNSPSDIPSAMVFRWQDGLLTNYGQLFTDSTDKGHSITELIGVLLKLRSQMIAGPPELLKRRIPGDWVIRTGLSEKQGITQLVGILNDQLSPPIQMDFRDVDAPFMSPGERITVTGSETRQEEAEHRVLRKGA